jgi:hypothetical protein
MLMVFASRRKSTTVLIRSAARSFQELGEGSPPR